MTNVEAIVVQVVLGNIPVRIIVAYGPQENALKEKKEMFWEFLEDEAILKLNWRTKD